MQNNEEVSQQFVKNIEACFHKCKISMNKSGYCGVRFNQDGKLYLSVNNRPIALAIDPIEKKPLHHFLPGSEILSLGTIGCNFHCEFCQNWQISQVNKDIEEQQNTYELSPQQIVNICLQKGLNLIAFTYNEPTIWVEYALEICKIAKQNNIRTVFVSNGCMSRQVAEELSKYISGINIDLKAFTQAGYQKLGGDLQTVCDNIEYFYHNNVIVEVTTLVVPGFNDSDEEIQQLTKFLSSISTDIPWHVSAFHPDYKLLDTERTPLNTLQKCYNIGKQNNLKYIYIGNVSIQNNDTLCPNCNKVLISRKYKGKAIGINKQLSEYKSKEEKDGKQFSTLYSTLEYKQTGSYVCKHFLEDRCNHGDGCDYIHEIIPKNMPFCKYDEKCSDIFCIYKHKSKQQVLKGCPDFKRGVEFDNCNCGHRGAYELICYNYLVGFCPDGPNCQKAHPIFTTPLGRAEINKQRLCPCIQCKEYHLREVDNNNDNTQNTYIQDTGKGQLFPDSCFVSKECIPQKQHLTPEQLKKELENFSGFIARNSREAVQLFKQVIEEMNQEETTRRQEEDKYNKGKK